MVHPLWKSLKKLKTELPYDLFLVMYPKKTIIQKDTCTPMFIAALFKDSQDMQTISRSIDRKIKKTWYIHNGLLLSKKKENEIRLFAEI